MNAVCACDFAASLSSSPSINLCIHALLRYHRLGTFAVWIRMAVEWKCPLRLLVFSDQRWGNLVNWRLLWLGRKKSRHLMTKFMFNSKWLLRCSVIRVKVKIENWKFISSLFIRSLEYLELAEIELIWATRTRTDSSLAGLTKWILFCIVWQRKRWNQLCGDLTFRNKMMDDLLEWECFSPALRSVGIARDIRKRWEPSSSWERGVGWKLKLLRKNCFFPLFSAWNSWSGIYSGWRKRGRLWRKWTARVKSHQQGA